MNDNDRPATNVSARYTILFPTCLLYTVLVERSLQVSIQLEQVWLNDEPSWYYLTYPDVELQQQAASSSRSRRYQSMDDDFGGPEGLSPTNSPSASRLSGDSILLDEMEGRQTHSTVLY